MIDSILTDTVLPAISEEFLNRMLRGEETSKVHVCMEDDKFQYEFQRKS